MSRFLVGQSGSPDINTRLPLCCGKGILNFLVGRSSHTLTTPFSYWHRLTLHKPSSSSSSWCISKFEPVHDKTGPAAMFLPGTPGERFFVATWLNFDAKFWTRFIMFHPFSIPSGKLCIPWKSLGKSNDSPFWNPIPAWIVGKTTLLRPKSLQKRSAKFGYWMLLASTLWDRKQLCPCTYPFSIHSATFIASSQPALGRCSCVWDFADVLFRAWSMLLDARWCRWWSEWSSFRNMLDFESIGAIVSELAQAKYTHIYPRGPWFMKCWTMASTDRLLGLFPHLSHHLHEIPPQAGSWKQNQNEIERVFDVFGWHRCRNVQRCPVGRDSMVPAGESQLSTS